MGLNDQIMGGSTWSLGGPPELAQKKKKLYIVLFFFFFGGWKLHTNDQNLRNCLNLKYFHMFSIRFYYFGQ